MVHQNQMKKNLPFTADSNQLLENIEMLRYFRRKDTIKFTKLFGF